MGPVQPRGLPLDVCSHGLHPNGVSVRFGSRRLAALLVVPAVILTACSSNSKPSSPSGSSATGGKTAVGVTVSGASGPTPTVTVPAKAPPPPLTQHTIPHAPGPPAPH